MMGGMATYSLSFYIWEMFYIGGIFFIYVKSHFQKCIYFQRIFNELKLFLITEKIVKQKHIATILE